MSNLYWSPQAEVAWSEMVQLFGDDPVAVRVTNALCRNGVTTLEGFKKLPLTDISDMRYLGAKSMERVRQARADLGVVEGEG